MDPKRKWEATEETNSTNSEQKETYGVLSFDCQPTQFIGVGTMEGLVASATHTHPLYFAEEIIFVLIKYHTYSQLVYNSFCWPPHHKFIVIPMLLKRPHSRLSRVTQIFKVCVYIGTAILAKSLTYSTASTTALKCNREQHFLHTATLFRERSHYHNHVEKYNFQ